MGRQSKADRPRVSVCAPLGALVAGGGIAVAYLMPSTKTTTTVREPLSSSACDAIEAVARAGDLHATQAALSQLHSQAAALSTEGAAAGEGKEGAAAAHAMLAGSYAAYKGLFVIAARPQPPVGRRHVLTSRRDCARTARQLPQPAI